MLDNLASPYPTNDAVILEFKFIPSGDTAKFQYMFASDEYEQWAPPVSNSFNDVFGFFISGPGIAGQDNIALIPGTTTPVAINNINPVTNVQYYNSNVPGLLGTSPVPNMTYNGYSDIFTATREVIPCDTYTLSLRLADAGDGALDTGVFLVGNSFGSAVSIAASSPFTSSGGDFVMYEGCNTPDSVSYTLIRDPNNTPQDTIDLVWQGTADLGTDYTTNLPNPSEIIFPAGDDEITITLGIIDDGTVEGPDTVELAIPIANNACGGQDTLKSNVIILDKPDLTSNALDTVPACLGSAVTLDAAGFGGVEPLEYLWPASGATTPTINYTANTDSVFAFQITDQCFTDTLEDSIVVNVFQPTTPLSLTTSPDVTICAGTPTVLQAFPTNGTGVYQYDWAGLGTADTLEVSPTTFTEYEVTVDDGCESLTDTVAVDVLPAMAVNVLSGSGDICFGESITFEVEATNGSGSFTYDWVDDNGDPAGNTPAITVSPNSTTTYTVTVSDGCSPDETIDLTATVADPVALSVSALDETLCEGQTTTLSADGTGGTGNYTYTWTLPDGSTSPGKTLTITPSQTGTYSMSMTEDCISAPLTESIQIVVIPEAENSFTVDPSPICEGAPVDVTFTGNYTNTPTFDWTFNGADLPSASTEGPHTIEFPTAGTYDLTLALSVEQNGQVCGPLSVTQQIEVSPQPVADFEVPAPQCLSGNSYAFEATGTRDNAIDYTWTFEDGAPASSDNIDVAAVNFTSAGTKTVSLALSGAGGLCTDDISKPVTVWPNPDAPQMQGDSLCPGYEATLFVANPTAGLTYYWNGGPGANNYTGTTLVTPRLNRSQTYNVISENQFGCQSLTRSEVLAYVYPKPDLSVSYSPQDIDVPNAIVTFTPTSNIPIADWHWEFGDRATSSAEIPVHQYTEPGEKTVAVTAVDENGCLTSLVLAPIAVEESVALNLPTAFSPNGDGLNDVLEADLSHLTDVSFRVFDRYGRLVFESNSPRFVWDGDMNGNGIVKEGVYPFILEYTLYDGTSGTRTGTVTVVR